MMENEEMEVLLSQSEGDGWVKARNYKGEEGFVPQNYLDLHIDDLPPAAELADVDDQQQAELDLRAAEEEAQAQVEAEAAAEADVAAEAAAAKAVAEAEAEGGYPLEAQISFSSVDYTYQPSIEEVDVSDVAVAPEIPPRDDVILTQTSDGLPSLIIGYCRALYDYDATSDEELTFYEGEVIGIIRRSGIHGDDVDDGWWQGQLLPDGPRGVFPSLVVEDCGPNGEELTPKVANLKTIFYLCS